MKRDLNNLWFEGIACGLLIDLKRGLNLVSLPASNGPLQYTSYDMLENIGDESLVSSIQRYDSTLSWQTTSWFAGLPSGENFDTLAGEGYIIYMNENSCYCCRYFVNSDKHGKICMRPDVTKETADRSLNDLSNYQLVSISCTGFKELDKNKIRARLFRVRFKLREKL